MIWKIFEMAILLGLREKKFHKMKFIFLIFLKLTRLYIIFVLICDSQKKKPTDGNQSAIVQALILKFLF